MEEAKLLEICMRINEKGKILADFNYLGKDGLFVFVKRKFASLNQIYSEYEKSSKKITLEEFERDYNKYLLKEQVIDDNFEDVIKRLEELANE